MYQRVKGMPEEGLVAEAQGGGVDAYNELVLKYQQLVYSVAYRILGNADRAADAAQDAFLRGYRALPRFRGGSFKAWILRITTNCCYDQLRRQQRRPSTPIDDLVEDEEHSTLLEDPQQAPEDRVEQRELNELIQEALETLPPDQRAVVIMCDVEGLSYEETAEAASIALGTVKSRLSRGRARLRQVLMEHSELLPSSIRLTFDD